MINRLKYLRKNILKLSQKEFGEKIHLKQTSYSEIENLRSALSERNIKNICQVFNVNEDWLRNGNEPIFNLNEPILEQFSKEYNLSPLAKSIIKRYLDLNDNERALFDNFINGIYEDIKKNKIENVLEEKKNQQEPQEMVKIVARGKGVTYISKEEMDEIEKNSRELTMDEINDLF